MSVQPFPFATLEAMTRAEVAASSRMRRAARAHVDLGSLARALSELARERVEVLVRRYRRADPARSSADAVAIVLEVDERPFLVELEAALAASLSARVLQRPPPRLVDGSRPPPPALTGAVCAIALAALRRVHAGSAFRVVEAGPAFTVAGVFIGRRPASTTAWLTIVIGPDAFDARVTIDDAITLSSASPPFAAAAVADVPIALPLVGATCLASRSEIAGLAPGDAFVVPGVAHPPKHAAFVAERGELGLAVEVADPSRVVVRGLVESFPWEVPPMNADAETTARVLEDASLVVRVELGSVEMKARDWAALAPGDVLTLGKKLGEPAVLRVAGVEVARGELVQVDGEYGVRIVSRTEAR